MIVWVQNLAEICFYIIISLVRSISSTALVAKPGRAESCGQYSDSFSDKKDVIGFGVVSTRARACHELRVMLFVAND